MAARTQKPLTLGEAVDALVSHDAETFAAEAKAVEKVRAARLEKRKALYARIPEEIVEEVGAAVGAVLAKRGGRVIDAEYDEPGVLGGIGGFGVDPKDSASLLELRQLIDEIGWPTFEAEERADYPARLRDLHRQRLAIAKALLESKAGNVEGDQVLAEILDEIAREVNDPHPSPVSEDGAREVKATSDAIPDLEPDAAPPPGATINAPRPHGPARCRRDGRGMGVGAEAHVRHDRSAADVPQHRVRRRIDHRRRMTPPLTFTLTHQPPPIEKRYVLEKRDEKGVSEEATEADLRALGWIPAAEASAHFDRVARVIRAMSEWTVDARFDLAKEMRRRWPELVELIGPMSPLEQERDAAITRAETAERERDVLRAEIAAHVRDGLRSRDEYEGRLIGCAAAHDSLRAEIDKVRGAKRDGCPCRHTTPCHPGCTCVNPASSVGCGRCCSYGSPEQQKTAAEWIAKGVDPLSASEATEGVLENPVKIMRDHRARIEGKCPSTFTHKVFRSEKEPDSVTVRCCKEAGHDGWHQDANGLETMQWGEPEDGFNSEGMASP